MNPISKSHQKAAFTLIEILLVLVITLGCFSVTTFSTRDSFQELEVQQFFYRFEREIKLTQLTAMAHGQQSSLVIQPDKFLFLRGKTITLLKPKIVKTPSIIGNDKVTFHIFSGTSDSTREIAFEWEINHQKNKRVYTFKLGCGNYEKE